MEVFTPLLADTMLKHFGTRTEISCNFIMQILESRIYEIGSTFQFKDVTM